ncbi:hypothetical protein HMPREF6485_2806 [Segatella buccae ATCC 33574]|uniref:Uncharacterized protein n=1 Tax=Segatella buccae ATCC 33574 TaxID=873513 RepID=E6KB19_9BACT|nr:hypothetical protein HMPREF6485_2806 [Segatella buccae ATCC 33574]
MKLGILSIAQIQNFCAKIRPILHISKNYVHIFKTLAQIDEFSAVVG